VFGEVVDGMDVVRAIENQPVEKTTNKPLKSCVIVNCGELIEGYFKSFPSNSSFCFKLNFLF
jgi:hypothetical protein